MPGDGVAIHRQTYWSSEWRVKTTLAPTPDSFSNILYITVICSESSRITNRTGTANG